MAYSCKLIIMHFNKQNTLKFSQKSPCLKGETTKQWSLICMRQQQNQCIWSRFRYCGKVIHVKRQGPQISECKLCITWRDLSHLSKTNPCNDRKNSNWRLQVEVSRPSEDATRQLLAKHAVKVQLSAHQILLYTLQRPLMVSQFQCLPLSLKSKDRHHMYNREKPTLIDASCSNYNTYLESFICICRHGHGSTTHLLLHDPRLVCTCGDWQNNYLNANRRYCITELSNLHTLLKL